MSQTDFRSSVEGHFRIEPVRPISKLRIEALAAAPPEENGVFRAPDLVDLSTVDAELRFDLRYATERNFMGTAFYASARALLQRPAAEALSRAAAALRRKRVGLVVYDAYRPWYVSKMFWDATPEELKRFVADPAHGSRHNRGAAVDLALYDLNSGRLMEMPSGYDEFTERAYIDYTGGSEQARRNRDLLRLIMEDHGFEVYTFEWWHFDHEDWRLYPLMNQNFEELI